jgi:hypothetical protein
MTIHIKNPDELVAVIPHMLGFKLFWTTSVISSVVGRGPGGQRSVWID